LKIANTAHANVVEFELKDLPANVFAVVPVILGGHQVYGDQSLNQHFNYQTFIEYTARYRRRSIFDELHGLDMHTSADLNPKVLSILNESIKIVEYDQFGEEKRISPPQKMILSKCDGLDLFEAKNVSLGSIQTQSSNNLPPSTKNLSQKRSRGSLLRGLKNEDDDDEEDESIDPTAAIKQHLQRDIPSKAPDELELRWMERAWALDAQRLSEPLIDSSEFQSSPASRQGTCSLWGHLSSVPFSKVFQSSTNETEADVSAVDHNSKNPDFDKPSVSQQ
jgi:hypothetical protein